MKKQSVRLGDVFQIPLSDGRIAYGQFVYRDKRNGPIIRVFDFISEREIPFEEVRKQLMNAKLLFLPVITGVGAAVRLGIWTIIGRYFVDDFVYPKFISVLDENYQPKSDWFLVDEEKDYRLGRHLPEEYKHLEFLVVWSPYDVVHRIETGKNPYKEMIIRG